MLNSVIAGLTSGGVYALLGLCVVLTYRLAAVVNFAMAAVGAVGAFVAGSRSKPIEAASIGNIALSTA